MQHQKSRKYCAVGHTDGQSSRLKLFWVKLGDQFAIAEAIHFRASVKLRAIGRKRQSLDPIEHDFVFSLGDYPAFVAQS
jgi:hypothetical protein